MTHALPKTEYARLSTRRGAAEVQGANLYRQDLRDLFGMTIAKMDEHASNLRKCIQAAADDTVPTAFVILPAPPSPRTFLPIDKGKLHCRI